MSFQIDRSILVGLSPATLQAYLTQAQTALATLKTGGQIKQMEVTGGGTHRNTIFIPPTEGSLVEWINLLKAALGLSTHSRRSFGVSFR